MTDDQIDELIERYINGNCIAVCLEILRGHRPALNVAKVAVRLATNDGDPNIADEFIRILSTQYRWLEMQAI